VFSVTLVALMCLHLAGVLYLAKLREEGPRRDLHLTSTSRALVLFGKNSADMTVYKLFDNWSALEAHLESESLRLPLIIEVSKRPPTSIRIEAIAPDESQGAREEHKILWSRDGSDRFVIHTPDSESAEALRNYVYFNGLESSPLGFSLKISSATNTP